jgi:hypothetical protein
MSKSLSKVPFDLQQVFPLSVCIESGMAEGSGLLPDVENDEFSRFERGESYHDVDDSSGLLRG